MNGLAAFAQSRQTAHSNPSVMIDLPDEGQETILLHELPPVGARTRRSIPTDLVRLLTQDIAVSKLYLKDLVYGLSPTGVTASAVTEDKYNVPRQISFREARAIASSVMEEAEQRRREAAEQEARFFQYLFGDVDDEEI
ncbi:MAG: hypothetical protein GH143_09495 [Calditrichaeota bacterium]|nr:hypothetical protein [Calditrichota bacterium]